MSVDPDSADWQAGFVAALFDPAVPVPGDLAGDDISAAARLALYRRHINASLISALAAQYKVICRLIGEACFARIAAGFQTAMPPRQRSLSRYGAEFPAYLSKQPELADYPYLADVARLEWARIEAWHAPVLAPAAPAILAAWQGGPVSLTLQPSLGYGLSAWPVDEIWRVNQIGCSGDLVLTPGWFGWEIMRDGDQIRLSRLAPPVLRFRAALAAGETLEAALSAAGQDFDLVAELPKLFTEGLVVAAAFDQCG